MRPLARRQHCLFLLQDANEVKGKSALVLSRDLNMSYKCAFVLLHKLREAMAEELKGRVVGGMGRLRRSTAIISAATSSLPTFERTDVTGAWRVIKIVSAEPLSLSANATETPSPPCSRARRKPFGLSRPVSHRIRN